MNAWRSRQARNGARRQPAIEREATEGRRGEHRGGQGRPRRPPAAQRLCAYGISHLQSLLHSLGRMARSPVSSLMTVAVIGIALALPAGLHVLLQNLQGVSAGWENSARISLFLQQGLAAEAVSALESRVQAMPEVASLTRIDPEQALAEFRNLSGFGEAVDALGENPLPTVLVIQPRLEYRDALMVETLLSRLRALPGVELAQLDMAWVRRLFALMEIAKRGVLVLAALLALAVLLIVGNTIRLAIENRRKEIEVQKLIGATDAFIRRPFLYTGIWHGLGGALVAWLLVNLSLALLDGPVEQLALLYDSRLSLEGMGAGVSLVLFAGGAVLGLTGAWLAVGRHLREIEPG
ncbi:MAG TPA: cell division protein FtsX [Gammaproteobacteria bacterium]|nr:cell division protein FtsX [Gammaproteobacteria bacterium]